MNQIITSIPVQKSPVHKPSATATVAGILRPPLTTVGQHDHLAAAAYLMKHTGTTALIVADAQTGQPAGIITGPDLPAGTGGRHWHPARRPLPLETSLPGVFAAGDVRRGSVKRVASAVGEGAGTIPQVHRYLHTTPAAPAATGQQPRYDSLRGGWPDRPAAAIA